MNLLLIGGTWKPRQMLQYLRLMRESGENAEQLMKVVFTGTGVRTQPTFDDLQFIFSTFVLQGCTGFTADHFRANWPGTFTIRPRPLDDEVHDIVWNVSWKQLFGYCFDELAHVALTGQRKSGLYEQLDFKLANGAVTLLFNTGKDVQKLFEDYVLFRQNAMGSKPRCAMCEHLAKPESGIGRCQSSRFLTGEERACKKFRPTKVSGAGG